MSRKRHLMQRGARWYYNRAFPKDVRGPRGETAFRVSLRTSSLEEALRARPEAERQFWAAVDAARASRAERRQEAPGEAASQSLAVDWFRRQLAGFEDLLELEQKDPARLGSALAQATDDLADARRELAEERGGPSAIQTAKAVAEAAGYREAGDQLPRLVARARIALAEIWEARLTADYGKRPGDPLFAAALETPQGTAPISSETPQRTLADLIDAFKAAKWSDMKPAGHAAYGLVFRTLRDTLGEARPLAEVSREVAREVFETVKALPKGYGKGAKWEGLDTRAAVAKGKREGLPTISAKTINGTYMGLSASLFGWAVVEGWLPNNPFKGLRMKDPEAARDKRDPFTDEQLAALFGSSPWSPRDASPSGLPARYWLPLFALFHGLRRGEIAQLKTADFRTVDGVTVFEVTGSLKNENARRTLALHPELARLGVLELVAERRKAKADYLFAGEADTRGKWGDAVDDWFSRLVQSYGFKGRRLGLHSLRHNFEDALRRAGLHGTPIGAALAGRKGGDPVAGAYGRGFAPSDLAEAIANVRYSALPDLPRR